MDLEKYYFHFLNGDELYENMETICLYRLESILKTGFILSRNNQIKTYGFYQEGVQQVNWNGFDNISICIKKSHNLYNIAFKEYDDDDINGFDMFSSENSICIILSPNIMTNKEIKINTPKYYLPGEFQIKDKISSNFFIGIGIYYEGLDKDQILVKKIKNILNKYNYVLPIINIKNGFIIEEEKTKRLV